MKFCHPAIRCAAITLMMVAAMVLPGCDNAAVPAETPPPQRFIYVEPPKPIATLVPEGMSQWIDTLAELNREIAEVEQKFATVSTLHRETSFDELLQIDLKTLSNDQLCYVWHFADKGYFTVEREIMLNILEERSIRESVSTSSASNIAERAQRLAERYRSHLSELQLAIDLYEKTQTQQFTIPNILDAEQLEVLRGMVEEKLSHARTECEALDARLADLRGELGD